MTDLHGAVVNLSTPADSSLIGRLATSVSNMRRIWLLLLILPASLFSLFMPALFVFLFLLILSFMPHNRGTSIAVSALNAVLLFGWINVEKIPINDWAWYTKHYGWLERMPLSSYLGHVFDGLTIKWTEPVYHTLSALLSRLTGGSVLALTLVVTTIIYGNVAAGIAIMVRGRLKSALEAVLITWVPICIGITFTLTAQLVRQEIAASLLFLGLMLLWVQRQNWGWALVVMALLTHNSSVFPALCVFMAVWFTLKTNLGAPYWVTIVFLLGVVLGGMFLLSPSGDVYYENQQNDGTVSTLVYILDVAIFLALLLMRQRLSDLGELTKVVIACVIAYAGLIVAVSPAPLLGLRMYFYMDYFRAAMLVLLVLAFSRTRMGWILGAPFGFAALVYVEARIAVSPFYFHGGVLAHLMRPFAFFQ